MLACVRGINCPGPTFHILSSLLSPLRLPPGVDLAGVYVSSTLAHCRAAPGLHANASHSKHRRTAPFTLYRLLREIITLLQVAAHLPAKRQEQPLLPLAQLQSCRAQEALTFARRQAANWAQIWTVAVRGVFLLMPLSLEPMLAKEKGRLPTGGLLSPARESPGRSPGEQTPQRSGSAVVM